MLTNLLSLYIASVIQDSTPSAFNLREDPSPSIVRTASANLSDIEESKFIPLKNPELLSPVIKANASLAMDLRTGVILFENNSHDRLQIASLTKLMTATIIVEENNLDEVVTVSRNAAQATG
ncbi:MAG: hypothetical protein WCX95_00745, partial [Candidatus Gracilibacteria bacterium]